MRLEVASERGPYTVLAETGALGRLDEIIIPEVTARPRAMVSDMTVGPLWARAAAEALAVPEIEVPDGEAYKRWSSVESLLVRWLELGLHRGDAVAAVGGGVVTDMVGFAAAVFLRGITWLAVPTTLLAMVDAAVGGKTGVNLEQGKNLVGAFWPPQLVVIDVATLSTLPVRELRAGAAEVIKTAWIGDHDLLELLPADGLASFASMPDESWQQLVLRCLAVKAAVVAADEREAGARAALNFGHTLGHALEAVTGYTRFLHGEAVAWGLLAATELGCRRGTLSEDAAGTMRRAIRGLEPLPAIADIDPDALRAHLDRDKKRDDDGVKWVLPTDGGVSLGHPVASEEALEVFDELQRIQP